MDEDDTENFTQTVNGQYEGVGVSVSKVDNSIEIVAILLLSTILLETEGITTVFCFKVISFSLLSRLTIIFTFFGK